MQDAYHVAMNCEYTNAMREAVVEAADSAMEGSSEEDSRRWARMQWVWRLRYTLSTEKNLSDEREKRVMTAAAAEWYKGMKMVEGTLKRDNAGFTRTLLGLLPEGTACNEH